MLVGFRERAAEPPSVHWFISPSATGRRSTGRYRGMRKLYFSVFCLLIKGHEKTRGKKDIAKSWKRCAWNFLLSLLLRHILNIICPVFTLVCVHIYSSCIYVFYIEMNRWTLKNEDYWVSSFRSDKVQLGPNPHWSMLTEMHVCYGNDKKAIVGKLLHLLLLKQNVVFASHVLR